VLFRQHLVGEDVARLADPGRVERLEALIDERAHGRAALRPVVFNWFAFEE
jgi:hypothetical protein